MTAQTDHAKECAAVIAQYNPTLAKYYLENPQCRDRSIKAFEVGFITPLSKLIAAEIHLCELLNKSDRLQRRLAEQESEI